MAEEKRTNAREMADAIVKFWYAKGDVTQPDQLVNLIASALEVFEKSGLDLAKKELERLQAGIRQHRDERGHDRCWLDDQALYLLLPDGVDGADTTLPPLDEFLRECERFHKQRNGGNSE